VQPLIGRRAYQAVAIEQVAIPPSVLESLRESARYPGPRYFRVVRGASNGQPWYAVYYHAILVSSINTAQAILWIFTFLAAPLLAALGAQVAYLVFKSKIEGRKKENRQREREERSARMAEQNGE